jgi:hypothetical protein
MVEVADLVMGEKIVILKNARSQYNVEVADFTNGNMLPTFSFILTEFKNKGFQFHITWQWIVGTWRERAFSVWGDVQLRSVYHHLCRGEEKNLRILKVF